MVGNTAKDWKFDIDDCKLTVLLTGKTLDTGMLWLRTLDVGMYKL